MAHAVGVRAGVGLAAVAAVAAPTGSRDDYALAAGRGGGPEPAEVIERGAELCGLTLEELWQQTLDAMRSCEDSINRQMEEI